jgi:PKD repeat protein
LVFTAAGFAGVTSDVIVVQAIPTSTTITGDSPDPSVSGGAVTVTFAVAAQGVVPIGTVTVTDGAQSCSGTLTGGSGSCTLSLNTVGTRTLRATYAGSAGLSGSSDTESHQVDAPPVGNNPPVADYNWNCDGLTCQFTDASHDGDGSVVAWNWNFGDNSAGSAQREPSHTFPTAGRYTVRLMVTDDDGSSDDATATVEVQAPPPPPPPPPPTNQPPVAAFTSSCNQLTCSFDSDGSNDPDGRITGYRWNFGDGTESTDRNPRHTYAVAGPYTVTLMVVDDDGAASTPVSHQVIANNPPPPNNKEPHAGFDARCEFMTCSFQDQSRDDDGTIVSRTWQFGDNGTSSETNPSHTYTVPGKYRVILTVTDDRGGTDTEQRDVEAKAPPAPNQAPTAAFSANCPQPGLECSFNSDASSDIDGDVRGFSWNFGDGTGSNEPNPRHSYAAGGTYDVTLTVTDNDGAASNPVTHQVSVAAPPPPNQGPTAAFSATCPQPGLACSFNSDASSDNDGSIVGWSWTFGDGSSSNERNPSHAYAADGNYTVTLVVTDDDGATDEETHQVSLTAPTPPNEPPTAAFTAPASCTAGEACAFGDASTDPDGTVIVWNWDFGDGGSSDQRSPSHTYSTSGTYDVKLRVTDNGGDQSSEAQHTVTVNEAAPSPNSAPVAQIGSITCTGMHCDYTDDSTDADGAATIASYAWVFGDGSSDNGRSPSHDYADAGSYHVTLTVTDDHDASSQADTTVAVAAPTGSPANLLVKGPPS